MSEEEVRAWEWALSGLEGEVPVRVEHLRDLVSSLRSARARVAALEGEVRGLRHLCFWTHQEVDAVAFRLCQAEAHPNLVKRLEGVLAELLKTEDPHAR